MGDGTFLVEDFINAITSQLDRVQDALRLKAVNRPLTYALKDLSLELQVFVELDVQGNVRFRTSGPNETGASTVHLGFTTITKPMIEENTITLAQTRSPSLAEIGLGEEEQKRLGQLGVHNAGQLQRLGAATGTQTVARYTGVPVDRLRDALKQGRPSVGTVKPAPPPGHAPTPSRPTPRPAPTKGPVVPPVFKPPTPPVGETIPPRPGEPRPAPRPPVRDQVPIPRPGAGRPVAEVPIVPVRPDTRRLHLSGRNLIGEDGPPRVRLNNQELGLAEAEDDRLVVELPEQVETGALEIELPDGEVLTYSLSLTPDPSAASASHGNGGGADQYDPWEPGNGEV